MAESVAERFRRNEVAELLARYPELRLIPSGSMDLRIEGTLRFSANSKKTGVIDDEYYIRVEAPEHFPGRMALAWEMGGRIPRDYHKLTNGALCLGSRVRLRLQMSGSPSLLRFVERCVIPYLYGYSYSVKHGTPPFGELAHGELGSLQDLAGLLGVEDLALAFRYCMLAAMKRRRANKQRCPCGGGRRLGHCHNGRVNALRKRVGRAVLASEMTTIALAFREPARGKGVATDRKEVIATASARSERSPGSERMRNLAQSFVWPGTNEGGLTARDRSHRLDNVHRLVTVLLGLVVAASTSQVAALHIHAYADHDHPEHHHGLAAHAHPAVGGHHHADGPVGHDGPTLRADDNAGDHAVSVSWHCTPVLDPHVIDADCGGALLVAPRTRLERCPPVRDIRVHGPPIRTQAPPRAPPPISPA